MYFSVGAIINRTHFAKGEICRERHPRRSILSPLLKGDVIGRWQGDCFVVRCATGAGEPRPYE